MIADSMIFLLPRSLTALLLVMGTLYVSWSVASVWLGADRVSTRWCGTCVVGLWGSSVAFQLMIWTGTFKLWSVLALVGGAVAVCRAFGATFSSFRAAVNADLGSLKGVFSREFTGFSKACLFVLTAGAILLLSRTLVLPPVSWDAITYHAVRAGMWCQEGRIWVMNAPGQWTVYRTYFGGGEALQALAMLSFHSDILFGAVDAVQWLFLILALYAFGRSIGLDQKASLVGAAIGAFLPVMIISVGSGYVELLGALGITLCILFFSLFLQSSKPAYLFLGCLALGVAGGLKVLAAPSVALLLCVVTVNLLKKQERSAGLIPVLGAGLLAMAAVILPWPIHNIIETGYPLGTLPVTVLGIKLGVASQPVRWLMELAADFRPYSIRAELKGLLLLFGVHPHILIAPNFSLVGLLAVAALPFSLRVLWRRNAYVACLLMALVGASLVMYYFPSFSLVRIMLASVNARFLYATVFLTIMVDMLLFQNGTLRHRIDLLLLAPCVFLIASAYKYWSPFEYPYLMAVGVLSLIAPCAWVSLRKRLSAIVLISLVSVLAAGYVVALGEMRTAIRYRAADESYFFHGFPRYWVDAARAVDEPHVSHKIAVTAGPNQHGTNLFMYYFMGSSLQNRIDYVPICLHGAMVTWGHDYPGPNLGSYDQWLAEIRHRGITEVMSFRPKTVELAWMESHPETFEKIAGEVDFGLFRVKAQSGSEKSRQDSERDG